MPEDILMKIKFLCREIPKVEWSGILLYKVEGTIRKPKDMVLHLKDIIPMNKGTQVYTSYNFNEKSRDTSNYDDAMIDYFNDNLEAMEDDWKIGHIHSHNGMNVYFSGTDMSELHDNSLSHNIYLSLIVNNWMEFTAKVAFRAGIEKTIEAPRYALDQDGEKYSMGFDSYTVKSEKLYIHDCDIDHPAEIITADKTFVNSVKRIIKKAEVVNKPKHTTYPKTYVTKPGVPVVQPRKTGFSRRGSVKTSYPAKQAVNHALSTVMQTNPHQEYDEDDYEDEDLFKELDQLEGLEDASEIEIFVISLLNGTNPPNDEIFSVETALEEIDAFKADISSHDISKIILDNYASLYEKLYEEFIDEKGHFVETGEQVVDLLEEHENEFPFIGVTIIAIKLMLTKYKIYESTLR